MRDALAARQGPNAVHEISQTPTTLAERAKSEAESQAELAKTYWQSLANEPGAERDEDSLHGKVRDALATRQGLQPSQNMSRPQLRDGLRNAKRELRRELQRLIALVWPSGAIRFGVSFPPDDDVA